MYPISNAIERIRAADGHITTAQDIIRAVVSKLPPGYDRDCLIRASATLSESRLLLGVTAPLQSATDVC